jgi:hypothetical protein
MGARHATPDIKRACIRFLSCQKNGKTVVTLLKELILSVFEPTSPHLSESIETLSVVTRTLRLEVVRKRGHSSFLSLVAGFPTGFYGNMALCEEPHELPSEGFATTFCKAKK